MNDMKIMAQVDAGFEADIGSFVIISRSVIYSSNSFILLVHCHICRLDGQNHWRLCFHFQSILEIHHGLCSFGCLHHCKDNTWAEKIQTLKTTFDPNISIKEHILVLNILQHITQSRACQSKLIPVLNFPSHLSRWSIDWIHMDLVTLHCSRWCPLARGFCAGTYMSSSHQSCRRITTGSIQQHARMVFS